MLPMLITRLMISETGAAVEDDLVPAGTNNQIVLDRGDLEVVSELVREVDRLAWTVTAPPQR